MTYFLALILMILAEIIYFFLPTSLKRKWLKKFGSVPPKKTLKCR